MATTEEKIEQLYRNIMLFSEGRMHSIWLIEYLRLINIRASLTYLKDVAKNNPEAPLSVMTESLEGMVNSLSEALGVSEAGMWTERSNIRQQLTTYIGQIKSLTQQLAGEVAADMLDTIKGKIDESAEGVKTFVKEVTDEIALRAERNAADITGLLGRGFAAVQNVLTAITGSFLTPIQQGVQSLVDLVTGIPQRIFNLFADQFLEDIPKD